MSERPARREDGLHALHALHLQAHHGSDPRPRRADRLRVGDNSLSLRRLVAIRWARRELKLTALEDDRSRVFAAFDAIAERLADGRRHLTGDRFTAADLTFACLAAAVIVPPNYGVALPQPDVLPQAVKDDVEAFRAHPAGAYALSLFATRPVAAAGA